MCSPVFDEAQQRIIALLLVRYVTPFDSDVHVPYVPGSIVLSPKFFRSNTRSKLQTRISLQAVCDAPGSEDLRNLDYLEQHTTACYVRLRRTGQIDPRHASQEAATSASVKNMNNNVSILKLCGSLRASAGDDLAQLQDASR